MKDQWLTGILLLVFIGGGIAGLEKNEDKECAQAAIPKILNTSEKCLGAEAAILGAQDSLAVYEEWTTASSH